MPVTWKKSPDDSHWRTFLYHLLSPPTIIFPVFLWQQIFPPPFIMKHFSNNSLVIFKKLRNLFYFLLILLQVSPIFNILQNICSFLMHQINYCPIVWFYFEIDLAVIRLVILDSYFIWRSSYSTIINYIQLVISATILCIALEIHHWFLKWTFFYIVSLSITITASLRQNLSSLAVNFLSPSK